MNLRALDILVHDTIKLHKQYKPISPIVNWKDSPGYKLEKYMTTELSNICVLQPSKTYNIKILVT
jgi:hypothetical protein